MTIIQVTLLDPVLKQAEALARREQVNLSELVSLAATHAIGQWSAECTQPDRNLAGRKHFLQMLERALDPAEIRETPDGDKT